MNICQIITPSKIAGAERSTTSLCEHLQAAGHRVVVGCKAGSPLIPAMRDAGLDARSLRISGKLNIRGPLEVARLARETHSVVLHSQLSTAAVHASVAARIARLPSVAHVRALNSPLCYRFADRIIAVSHAVKEHLVNRGIPAGRVDVVYNGVDPGRYYLPCSRAEARAALGLPDTGPLIGIIAHLSAKKGHAVFVEAFAQIAARYPGAQVLFLGDGVQREALRAQTQLLGLQERIHFLGFHADVLPYYAALDLIVLPSIEGEGLPRALLEGGLLGRASIGTRLSGTPEIIRDGETGFVVPCGDVAALAERLDILLADEALREQMGAAARDWVGATFTIPAMVAGTLATYAKAGVRL